jgi:hypothetical protein
MEYKVISLSVGGLGNKVFKSGDVVKTENFEAGLAPKLVEQGFLKALSSVDVEGVAIPTSSTTTELKDIEDYTANELKSLIKELGGQLPKVLNKATLYKTYSELI